MRATGRLGYACQLTPYAGGISVYLVLARFGLVGLVCILTPGGHAYALGRFIIFNERKVFRILSEYIGYYNSKRSHQGLGPKISQGHSTLSTGALVKIPIHGGLFHHYERTAA